MTPDRTSTPRGVSPRNPCVVCGGTSSCSYKPGDGAKFLIDARRVLTEEGAVARQEARAECAARRIVGEALADRDWGST